MDTGLNRENDTKILTRLPGIYMYMYIYLVDYTCKIFAVCVR